MEHPARLFTCTGCNQQIIICSDCDSGQIYCSKLCSQTARQISCRAADARYQKTEKGRRKHADRQNRYRKRQQQKQKKVTDQSSLENSSHDVLPVESNEEDTVPLAQSTEEICCHFCKKPVSNFLRHDLFKSRQRKFISPQFF